MLVGLFFHLFISLSSLNCLSEIFDEGVSASG